MLAGEGACTVANLGLPRRQHIVILVSMIPPFGPDGNLPSGIYGATWPEIAARFGWNAHRQHLLDGVHRVLAALAQAGCRVVYLNGSFVTAKEHPRDYDACWGLTGVDVDALDPVLLDFDDDRAAQRAKYGGE